MGIIWQEVHLEGLGDELLTHMSMGEQMTGDMNFEAKIEMVGKAVEIAIRAAKTKGQKPPLFFGGKIDHGDK